MLFVDCLKTLAFVTLLKVMVSNFAIVCYREELLSIVRKHSHLLGQSALDEKDDGDDEVDMRFWREMLDMFFIRGISESKSHQDDDMIFFVRTIVCLVLLSFLLCALRSQDPSFPFCFF